MTITVTHTNATDAATPRQISRAQRQETIHTMVVLSAGQGEQEWARASWHMGRSPSASVVTCLLYTHRETGAYSGTAGGGGYCRSSASFEDAMISAGYTPSEEVGGVGMGAVGDAMLAMARDMGATDPLLVWA